MDKSNFSLHMLPHKYREIMEILFNFSFCCISPHKMQSFILE